MQYKAKEHLFKNIYSKKYSPKVSLICFNSINAFSYDFQVWKGLYPGAIAKPNMRFSIRE